jgi:hypothetical protein
MPWLRIFTVLLMAATPSLLAQEEPHEDVFNHSSRDLVFRVPPEFQLVTQSRRYLNPTAHEVPRFQRIWQHGSDGIMVNVVVLPDASWQQWTPEKTFEEGLAKMLSDPTLKLAVTSLTVVQLSRSHAITRVQTALPSGWIVFSRSLICSCLHTFRRSRRHGTIRPAKHFFRLSHSSLRSE